MHKGGKADKWAARSQRLASALRENLKRRKAQARGRATAAADDDNTSDVAPMRGTSNPDFRRNRGNE
jgi:hypothetical protein